MMATPIVYSFILICLVHRCVFEFLERNHNVLLFDGVEQAFGQAAGYGESCSLPIVEKSTGAGARVYQGSLHFGSSDLFPSSCRTPAADSRSMEGAG
jgi:hypothetical protein